LQVVTAFRVVLRTAQTVDSLAPKERPLVAARVMVAQADKAQMRMLSPAHPSPQTARQSFSVTVAMV
jgi:hypothetical protein